jgi:hypothetical protein
MVYANSHLCSHVDCCRAPAVPGGLTLRRCLYLAPLSNPLGQCRWATPAGHCPQPRLYVSLGPQRHSRLPRRRLGLLGEKILTPEERAAALGRGLRRTATRLVAPKPTHARQTPQHLDAGAGRRGVPPAWLDAPRAQHREHSPGHPAPGRFLAAGQALDHQPRSRIRAKKKPAIA